MLLNFLNIGRTGQGIFLFSHLVTSYPFVTVVDDDDNNNNNNITLYLDFEEGVGR